MAIKMGKMMVEVVCPLCKNVWLLEDNEWFYTNPKDMESTDCYFYCNECEKNVNFKLEASLNVLVASENKEIFKDPMYYEDEEYVDLGYEDEE